MISYYVNTTPWFFYYYQEFYILKHYIINNSTGGIVKSFEHRDVFFWTFKECFWTASRVACFHRAFQINIYLVVTECHFNKIYHRILNIMI